MRVYQDNVREVFYEHELKYRYVVEHGYPLYHVGIFSNCIVYGNSTKDWWLSPKQGAVTYLPFLFNDVKIRIRTCNYKYIQ